MEYVIIAASIVLLVVYFILFLICLFGIDCDDMREAYKRALIQVMAPK
jgi:hypothetical protein